MKKIPHICIKALGSLFTWMIPITCALCQRKSNSDFCSDCCDELPWIKSPCLLCARELPAGEIKICGKCLRKPPPIDRHIALLQYEKPIIALITKMKFQKEFALGHKFGALLGERIKKIYLEENIPLPNWIMAIPLHEKRLKVRGYNQALEIARPISKALQIPIALLALKRIIPTAPQTLIDHDQRKKNVSGCFYLDPAFQTQHVALVDDVMTTGSTLYEAVRVLRNNGVKKIDVWCVARGGSF